MAKINKRQVGFGGNFSSLYNFAKKAWVKALPFVPTQTLTLSGVEYSLISATELPGNISLGTSSTYSGGIVAAELAGAVGTAATTRISDSLGNIANIVPIRDAVTNDPIQYLGFEVFGLIQASNGTSDGAAIGAAASENLQVSFVYIAAGGTVTLATVTATIEFAVRVMLTEENLPIYEVSTGSVTPDIVEPTGTTQKVAKYVVTTAFAANEVVTLTTGAGGVSGVSTPSGEYSGVVLGASANAFRDNNQVEILENGIEQVKSSDFIWDSNTTGHFIIALDVTDTFSVKYFA